MAGTERDVRDLFVSTIRGIAVTELGFDHAQGNVHDYLLDYETEEKVSEYLSAEVSGQKLMRAWGISVTADEEVKALTNGVGNFIVDRLYRVQVVGYYERKPGGVQLNLLVDHTRKIREAVYGLGSKLGGLVDRFLGSSPLQINVVRYVDSSNGILEGRTEFQYTESNPAF